MKGKGLTSNCMDPRAEAYAAVQDALQEDPKSLVCWHTYGQLYQADKLYGKALYCYQNALEIDPNNLEILRDLSVVQVQTQDLIGFVETRRRLLVLEQYNHINWIGLAVAHHLNSNCSEAIRILEIYEACLEDHYPPDSKCQEHGDMLLYKIYLMEECGSLFLKKALQEPHKKESGFLFLERALKELHLKESKIVDKLAVKEQEASLLLKLNRLGEGKKIYRALISEDPDNYRYYAGLHKCLGLSPVKGHYSSNQIQKLVDLYKKLRKYSCSSAVKRVPLEFLQGKKFQKAADVYIRPLLTKGVPSLFSDLSPLYEHPDKVDLIEKLILKLERSIKKYGGFPGRAPEPPSTLTWTLVLLAQHYDRCGRFETALAKIDEAIQHGESVIDLHSVKGRILKHAGDLSGAAALADKASSMNSKDHYLTKKCVKRMLQADEVSMAEVKVQSFKELGVDDHVNLHMCYEVSSGESYFRQGNYTRALKKFLAVEKQCAAMSEGLFDLHSYCSRKVNFPTYVKMLKFQDQLYPASYFHKAVAGIISCYLKLYDSSSGVDEKGDEESKLVPSQAKKFREKTRDVEGHVEKVEDLLLEATKFLKLLQRSSSESLETHVLSFELNMRKKKFLLALQAVINLRKLDHNSPDTHRCLIRFLHEINRMAAPVTDSEKMVYSVLKEVSADLASQDIPPTKLNETFLDKNKDSLMHRAAAGEMLFLLEPRKKSEIIKLIEDTKNGALDFLKQWKLKDCIAVHELLETVLDDSEAALRWKARCRLLFPLSNYFNPPNWILDSGATRHFATKDSLLYDTKQLKKEGTFTTADGKATSFEVTGSYFLPLSVARGPTIHLTGVILCPGSRNNIVSIPEFVKNSPYVVEFFHNGYLIRDHRYGAPFSTGLNLFNGPLLSTGRNSIYVMVSASCGTEHKRVEWMMDSGAGFHATSDKSILRGVKPCTPGTGISANGTLLPYQECGSFTFPLKCGGIVQEVKLKKVYVVPGLGRGNLISIRILAAENECSVLFSKRGFYILNQRNGKLDRPDLVRASGAITNKEYIYVPQLPEKMKIWKPFIEQMDDPKEEEEEMDDI